MPGSLADGLLFAVVCVAIVLVDYHLGLEAEYLDAYEILRRGVLPHLPDHGRRSFWAEGSCGAWALPIAWTLWMLEAGAVTVTLRGLWRLAVG